jgi:hypothetical protein
VEIFLLQAGDKCSAGISDIDGEKDEAAAHRDFRLVLSGSGTLSR